VLGKCVEEVLGVSLANLLRRAETVLVREPTYLGTVGPFGDRAEMIVTAHQVQGAAIIEAEPAVRPASAATTLASIRSITERIGGANSILEACNFAARQLRRITGYDRVMIYQFLPDGSGSVIAEEREEELLPYLNHRYPASDIPKQARELYRRSAIRVIPDVDYTPVALEPVLSPITQQPLDMSHCALRSVSPVHIRYLKNMGVGASMSVSLLPRGQLWGLIAGHNRTARFVSYEAQEACRHVGQILSQQIRAREDSEEHHIVRTRSAARDKALQALVQGDDFLNLCPTLHPIVLSHGVAVSWKGTVVTAGLVPSESQVHQLVAWLEPRMSSTDFFVTDRLSEEYPEAAAFASEASGLLSIVLRDDDSVVVMWFRTEQVEEIKWAGNPHQPVEPGTRLGALSPRKSFATWQEVVRGRSRPWGTVEIESARGFSERAAFVLQEKKVRELNHLLRQANEQLAGLASTDGLTGVANRRAFDEHLQREWARAIRSRRSLALIILDLDFFKQYNDHFGHPMGDECLKQVAHVLQHERRPTDLAARIGGEEFSLILPDTDIEGAMAVAESVRSRIEGLHLDHAKSPMGVVTASFGVAVATADRSGTAQDLIQAADTALYEAKKGGRNRVVQG
jgi:two-component system, chemotaxis family, sensor kinase Cph1